MFLYLCRYIYIYIHICQCINPDACVYLHVWHSFFPSVLHESMHNGKLVPRCSKWPDPPGKLLKPSIPPRSFKDAKRAACAGHAMKGYEGKMSKMSRSIPLLATLSPHVTPALSLGEGDVEFQFAWPPAAKPSPPSTSSTPSESDKNASHGQDENQDGVLATIASNVVERQRKLDFHLYMCRSAANVG